jgi:basic membrane protein A and related proteins
MRRKSWGLIALLLVLTLIAAACGGDGDNGDTGDTPENGENGENGEGAEAPESDVQVGLVFDIGGRGDQSFNDAAARGLDQAEEEFGVQTQDLEPSGGGENREELLRLLSQDEYPLIFGIGFAFGDSIGAVAEEFPDTTYAIVDSVVEQPNVASLVFAEHEGSFLVGAAAAMKSESGQIGFIGGVEIDLIQKFEAGFVAGAEHVNPDIQVEVSYISQPPDFAGFNDPARAKEIAASMYQGGADIVYHAAGGSGSGLFDAAREASDGDSQVWAIGVDSDQYLTADEGVQDYILTSMLKQVDVAVYETIRSFVEGEDVGGVRVFDLASDGVGYSTSGGFVDDITGDLDELKQQIVDGEIEVPETP